MGISIHILDTSRGRPAPGVDVVLERAGEHGFEYMGHGKTDDDGRVKVLLAEGKSPEPGVWRITFQVARYFEEGGVEAFYPQVQIQFHVRNVQEHYHVPLLLNPYGYSTYRGS